MNAHARGRRGLTLLEMTISLALASAMVTGLVRVGDAALRGTARTVGHADALRGALLAVEALRADVSRMVMQQKGDLSVLNGGHGLSMLVPARPAGSDPWSFAAVPVTWRLAPVPGGKGTFSLVRTGPEGKHRLNGCWLTSFFARLKPAGTLSAGRAFLELTVTATGSPMGGAPCTASFLVPVEQSTI